MDRMTEAKRQYHDIPIPEELSERVMLEVKKAESNCGRKAARTATQSAVKKRTAVAAAVAAVLFVAGVNTSEAFAREVDNIPVIGALARILTFRSYEVWTEDLKISVEIPGVEVIAEELAGLEKEVNEDIYSFCERYAQEAEQRAAEYRQIFLDTGGTEEEWAAHEITIKVWYEVKSHSDRYLSLTVKGAESWTSAYSEERYYNLDMETGMFHSLGTNRYSFSRTSRYSHQEQIIKSEKTILTLLSVYVLCAKSMPYCFVIPSVWFWATGSTISFTPRISFTQTRVFGAMVRLSSADLAVHSAPSSTAVPVPSWLSTCSVILACLPIRLSTLVFLVFWLI